MNSITKPLRGISIRSAQFLAIATLAAASLLPTGLCAQNPEWMLFSPKGTGVPKAGMLQLLVSPDGRIWTAYYDAKTATPYGLAVFDGRKWTVYNKRNSGLPDDSAGVFAFDKLGNAWIYTRTIFGASGGSGLVKFDGTNWTRYTKQNSGLPSDNVWAGTIDPQGRIWLATTSGVARYDGENWTVFNILYAAIDCASGNV